MFHHFHGQAHAPGQGSLSAAAFRRMLEHIGLDRIVPAREWLRRACEGTLEMEEVCLTFDDNLRCQYDVAFPVMRELGLSGFWFVATGTLEGTGVRLELYRRFRSEHFPRIDAFYDAFHEFLSQGAHASEVEQALASFDPARYLAAFDFYTDADRRFRYVRDEVLGARRYERVMDGLIREHGVSLEALAAGLWMDRDALRHLHEESHVIGLHSHSHPTRLGQLSAEVQFREYRDNFTRLREVLGESPQTMSHPCNSYNDATLTILRRLGITLGFRSNMTLVDISELEYPRRDHANLLREMTCASLSTPATNPATLP